MFVCTWLSGLLFQHHISFSKQSVYTVVYKIISINNFNLFETKSCFMIKNISRKVEKWKGKEMKKIFYVENSFYWIKSNAYEICNSQMNTNFNAKSTAKLNVFFLYFEFCFTNSKFAYFVNMKRINSFLFSLYCSCSCYSVSQFGHILWCIILFMSISITMHEWQKL